MRFLALVSVLASAEKSIGSVMMSNDYYKICVIQLDHMFIQIGIIR